MGAKGERTRNEILKIAERLVLQQGFAGTSIEQILEEAQITKGGFFYHFDGKNDLARHLILRYLEEDETFFLDLVSKAHALSEDPLQQFLIFLKLLAEAMGNLPEMHPGCLVASFTYESQQFNEDVHELNAKSILSWRKIFEEQLDRVLDACAPTVEIDRTELADMLTATIEGGIIVSRVLKDPQILVKQILQYRTYIRVLFGAT